VRSLQRKRADKQIWILRAIAKYGPLTKFQISKSPGAGKAGIHYTQVSRWIKPFKEKGFIKGKKEQGHGPGSGEFYDLTPLGLTWALSDISGAAPDRDFFNQIIPKYERFLPLIFGKWSYLKDRKVSEASMTMLSIAAYRQRRGMDEARIRESIESGMPGRPVISSLEAYFLLYLEPYDKVRPGLEQALISPEDRERLKQAIKEDQELAKHFHSILAWVEDYRNTLFDYWKERLLQKTEPQVQEPELTKEAKEYTNRRIQRLQKEVASPS